MQNWYQNPLIKRDSKEKLLRRSKAPLLTPFNQHSSQSLKRTDAERRWPPLCRRHIQIHLPGWKRLCFKRYFIETCSSGFIDNMTALVLMVAWCRSEDKPQSSPVKTQWCVVQRVSVRLSNTCVWKAMVAEDPMPFWCHAICNQRDNARPVCADQKFVNICVKWWQWFVKIHYW